MQTDLSAISLMLQKEIPTVIRPLATASSSWVYQKIERFSSTIACVKPQNCFWKFESCHKQPQKFESCFFGQKKGKEMKLCAKGVDGWWAVAITPFDFADIATVGSIFPCDFSKQQSSVLSLPSFLPSLLPSLHCTALHCGRENQTTDATLSDYISYPPSTRKVPTGYHMKVFFLSPVS
jgi:hypothetical protein